MAIHYSKPKGFVGRQLIYEVEHEGNLYGYTAAGSATLHLPGREAFLQTLGVAWLHLTSKERSTVLNRIVNNTFFHVEGPYPLYNFVPQIVKAWREQVIKDWPLFYKDEVLSFETLVEPPRTGECYRRDGWTQAGITQGLTCKRGPANAPGSHRDSWGGARIWNKDPSQLRPKLVFFRKPVDVQPNLKLTAEVVPTEQGNKNMALPVNPLFAQIAAAESFAKNPYIVAGLYTLEVKSCFLKKGRKGNYVIAEFKVLESTVTDPKFVPNAVGTSTSAVEDLSKDNAMGNIKDMLVGIVGCSKDELTPDVIAAALVENGTIDPDTKEVVVNPIVGTKVKLEAYMTTTKKGNPFTAKTWSHVPA